MADQPPPAQPQDGLRRCFICLMDENETGSSESPWVNPCPCTLEGHQDCMIQWVTGLEREGKEIRCPVCKAEIMLDEPWDPVMALGSHIYKAFSKISPGLILGGLGAGTWVGLAMYGNVAVRVFAGPDATYRFFFNDRNPRAGPMINWIHVAVLPTIAPALIIGQSFPVLGNIFFMPAAALYGVFHMARDDNFFSWPPSPQLAAAAFPYVRAVYNNLYLELLTPHEKRWERTIAGIPEPAPPANRRERNQQRRALNQNGGNDGGLVGGLLDAAVDMLDIPDFEVAVELQEGAMGEDDGIAQLEIVVEELEEAAAEEGANDAEAVPAADTGYDQPQQPQQDQQRQQEQLQQLQQLHQQLHQRQQQQQQQQQQPQQQQPAPAPRQRGLQASLRDVTNSLASTLLLPVLAAGMGELIRLVLPKHLTTSPGGFGRLRVRTGLLQEQWGRNLVGGCIYIVLRDAFKLYGKYRMAKNTPLRKIRNVERRRNNNAP